MKKNPLLLFAGILLLSALSVKAQNVAGNTYTKESGDKSFQFLTGNAALYVEETNNERKEYQATYKTVNDTLLQLTVYKLSTPDQIYFVYSATNADVIKQLNLSDYTAQDPYYREE